MSNQEMQFADPDWKPSQQPGSKTNPQEQEEYTPQPINTDYGEQNKWKIAPPPPPQQEGYTGLRPHAGATPGQTQGGNFGQRPYRRRGRGPWFWIIVAFIIISLMSGGWHFGRSPNGFGTDPNTFNPRQSVGKLFDYPVTGQPTIVINDPNGSVKVTAGQSNTDVTIQPVNSDNSSGIPNDIHPNISPDGKTITVNTQDSGQGPTDLNITVPQNANLQLITGTGNISVTGVDGQMTLTTNGAAVDLTVPSTSAFHVDASTKSGSIDAGDFPSVKVQNINSGSGAQATGNVGVSSQGQGTNVVINLNSGDINLNQR